MNVEDIERDPNARRSFLIQLCTGEAKDAVSGTVMLPPEGYNKAKSILRKMFGQTHIVAASHIGRVTKGGTIKEFESEKLLQLARDMENCEMNLCKLGYQADINSRGNMSAVVLRLPWVKKAQNSPDQGKEPDFSQLTKFVVKRAKLANTEYSRLMNTKPEIERERNKNPRFGGQSRRVSLFASTGSIKEQDSAHTSYSPGGRSSAKPKCYFCDKEGHTVERCFKFQGKSYDERKAFVSKQGLCNLCLSKGHFAKRCKKYHGCFIPGCGKQHHPMLHPIELNRDNKVQAPVKTDNEKIQGQTTSSLPVQFQNAQTGHCGGTTKKQVCLRVVPVKVFGRDNGIEKMSHMQ